MLRIATIEDFAEIKELIDLLMKDSIYSKMFEGYSLSTDMVRSYTNPETLSQKICLLSLDDQGKTIGLGVFDIVPWLYNDAPIKIARLAYIYLKPDYRGKGLGKELNTAFEYWGKQVGANWYSKGNSGKKDGYMKFETIYMKEVK